VTAANPYGQRNDGGRCACSERSRIFVGLSGFDRHRFNTTGQPGYDVEYGWRCATEAELGDLGLTLTPKGVWSREAPSWLTARHQDASGGPP
jgi:hypothetical protein